MGGGGGASEACGCDDACRRGWSELRWRRIWCASGFGDGNGVVGTDVLPCLWTVLDLNSCHADERRLVGVACFSVSLQSCVLALLSSFVSSMIKPDAAASPDSTDMMTCTAFHSVPCFYDWLLCVAPWVGVHGVHSCVTRGRFHAHVLVWYRQHDCSRYMCHGQLRGRGVSQSEFMQNGPRSCAS